MNYDDSCGIRAFLRGVDLRGANLRGANLSGVVLADADLSGADLTGADLNYADLRHANLRGANLSGAYMTNVIMHGVKLAGAVMPDGRPWEEYRRDHLAGICDTPEIVTRAVEAWGHHDWERCPMRAALGISSAAEAGDKAKLVAAWVALYDAALLPHPGAAER